MVTGEFQYHRPIQDPAGGPGDDGRSSKSNPENRFANNLLDKLLMYLDNSAPQMKLLRPSANFSRRNDFVRTNRMVKFFFKVLFIANRNKKLGILM